MTRTPDDSGRVSVFVTITLAAVLAVIAVSYDTAGYHRTRVHAQHSAAEAARAAAHQFLTAAGLTGTVTVDDDLTHITVAVQAQYEPQLLGLFGAGSRPVHATHTTVLVPH